MHVMFRFKNKTKTKRFWIDAGRAEETKSRKRKEQTDNTVEFMPSTSSCSCSHNFRFPSDRGRFKHFEINMHLFIHMLKTNYLLTPFTFHPPTYPSSNPLL